MESKVFLFKRKTAYEIAECDWSADVCSSDLVAFSQKQGVCQDYAHILIAMCRHIGIFARYVNGFLIGEGETHAWV